MIFFSGLVAIWDGISIFPVRYVEFLTALCFRNVPEYFIIMLIGKTMGGYVTFKMCNYFVRGEDLEEIILNNGFNMGVVAI